MSAFYFFMLGTALGTIIGAALGMDSGRHDRSPLIGRDYLPRDVDRPAKGRARR